MKFLGSQPSVDLTYSDVFLVPRRSEISSRLDVDLSPQDGTPATIPLVSSNMNSVTGPRLASVLARRGGIGILPQDLSLDDLAAAIAGVKAQPVPFDTAVVLPPSASVAEARRWFSPSAGHGIVVAEGGGGARLADVSGVLSATRLESALPDARLGDLVHGPVISFDASQVADPRVAFDLIAESGGETVLITDGARVIGTLSTRSALRSTIYSPARDSRGLLAVGAAIGINGNPAEKARVLASAGADVLVVDTAHGHQEGMLRALERVASLDLDLPIVAGNVVSAEGARDVVNAGATIVKVGVGPGAMCTTRMMTAVGRPQFSAVLDAAQTASALGAYVWADGGVRYPRDVALALAAGAASVMVGSWFAGTIEAPGELLTDTDGRIYKESWGMASTRAVRGRFDRLESFERARKELFAEGISSSRLYLDPLRPGLEDLLDMITSGIRSSFTYAGARTVSEFHERALVGLQSAAGYEEGKALPVSW